MKITKLSLVAIATMTLATGAMAADKGIDFDITGQAVVYYETNDGGSDNSLLGQDSSQANAGIQLNANSNLGNGFGLGLQGSALSTWGLEDHLVSGVKQGGLGLQGDSLGTNGRGTDYFNITKAYLTKQVGKTTLKMGRQELPKSLSPLAFSEGWNVFKNTFDAVVAINSDIQDTTIVGAYVSRSNNNTGDTTTFNDLHSGGASITTAKKAPINNAFMLTVANKSNKMAQPTLTYYALKDVAGAESGTALWADVKVDAGLPIKLALQGGQIDPGNNLDKTKVGGVKVTGKASNVNLSLAYTKVGGGAVSVQNVGTGVKTPLYTQMIYNQNHISRSASTVVLKGSMPAGPGKVIAQYGMTTDNAHDNSDYSELDIMYKTKLSGMNVFAAYIMRDSDAKDLQGGDDKANIVRVWTRYKF